MSDDKTLATFKIDKRNWLDFQALATASETNATKLLRDFIVACLDGRIDFESIQPVEQPPFNLDEQISVALSPLLSAITEIRADIEILKADRVNQPKNVKKQPLEGASNPSQVYSYLSETSSNMPLEAPTLEPLIDKASSVCLHCGSSELVKKGKSESVDKNGLSGRRVKCKSCKKYSTLWEPK